MTTPLQHQGVAHTNITISLDPVRSHGVRVEIDDVVVDRFDEFVRRGGGLGIAGRLWVGL